MPETDSPNIPSSPWLRPRAAATYLGIALGTLRNWTSAGSVPFARRGHVVRYHRDALDRWLKEGTRTTRAAQPSGQEPAEGSGRPADPTTAKTEEGR